MLFIWTVVPSAVQVLGAGRTGVRTDVIQETVDAAGVAGAITQWLMLVVIGLLALTRIRWVRFSMWQLVFLAPWTTQLLSSIVVEHRLSLTGVIYPLVGLIASTLTDRWKPLRTLGILTGVLAIGSLAMAALEPASGLLAQAVGTDKSLFAGTFLVGPLPHPNTLGQTLALGLPFVSLIRFRWLRRVFFAVTVASLVWTGSRASLVAGAIGLVLVLVWRWRKNSAGGWRRFTSIGLFVASAGVAIAGPVLVLTSNSESFTERGYIWAGSLKKWAESPVVGNGPHIYSRLATGENSVGQFAFHGHSEFVHMLVTSGVLGVFALAIVYAALLRQSWLLGNADKFGVAVWAPLFVTLGWLEMQTDFLLVGSLAWIVWMPIAVMLSGSTGDRLRPSRSIRKRLSVNPSLERS